MALKEIEIEFNEMQKTNLKGYTLIEGFPGMGLVGTIAAKYIIEKVSAADCCFREIGHIKSNGFVPIVRIHEGMPVQPSRIYVNDKLRLVVLISEQIIPPRMTEKLAEKVIGWVKEKGISRIISLAGINTGTEGNQKTIYGIASNEASKKFLEQHGVEIIKEGVTAGVTALMLLELKKENIQACSILGNVTIAADYKAAAALVEKLNEMLGLNINVEPLLKEAKETEAEIIKHLQKLKETHESVEKFQTEQTPMYT